MKTTVANMLVEANFGASNAPLAALQNARNLVKGGVHSPLPAGALSRMEPKLGAKVAHYVTGVIAANNLQATLVIKASRVVGTTNQTTLYYWTRKEMADGRPILGKKYNLSLYKYADILDYIAQAHGLDRKVLLTGLAEIAKDYLAPFRVVEAPVPATAGRVNTPVKVREVALAD